MSAGGGEHIRPEWVEAAARAMQVDALLRRGACWAIAAYREQAPAALAAVVPAIQAQALEDAVDEFEHNIGRSDLVEESARGSARWAHTEDAWEYQGPFMDWLRNRADALRSGELP